MTLSGRRLWVALAAALLAGGVGGSFLGGWRSARGLPGTEASADAGVSVQLDAGVSARSDCGAVVDHWTTITVPGPTRYLPAPGGGPPIAQPPEVVTLVVPDLRLTGSGDAIAALEAVGRAQGGASAKMFQVAPEKHWELGPVVLYRKTWDVTVPDSISGGASFGYSAGPFGARLLAATDGKSVTGGLALIWRF